MHIIIIGFGFVVSLFVCYQLIIILSVATCVHSHCHIWALVGGLCQQLIDCCSRVKGHPDLAACWGYAVVINEACPNVVMGKMAM